MFAVDSIGGCPDVHGLQTAFDIIQVPMGPIRWLQVVRQPGSQASGAEGTAHINPVSGRHLDRSQFSCDHLKGPGASKPKGIGARVAVNFHAFSPLPPIMAYLFSESSRNPTLFFYQVVQSPIGRPSTVEMTAASLHL